MSNKTNAVENKNKIPQVLPEKIEKKISAPSENEISDNKKDEVVKRLYNDYITLKQKLEELETENDRLLKLVSENFSKKEHSFENSFKRDELINNIINERDKYKALAVQKIKENILDEIKKEFSDVKILSIDELPKEFHKLVGAGISPLVSYKVILENETRKKDNKPASMGEINSNSEKEKEFYSSQEVDKLTKKQLSNPKIMNAVMKSMLKW